ncbi:MAG: uroporphyrinogen-III C-methyltransferase [Betaproteobacteria bacterium]|nr:uroporphyrinogen-III C-methyltransferase [Betaproteobacteria bacterium]
MEEHPALTQSRPGGPFAWLKNPLVFALLLLTLALAWNWYDSRVQMGALREELARRLRDSDSDSRDAKLVARQTQEVVREAQTRLNQLEAKLAESQNQQVALEALYQELSRNRDEWVLAEVEQILVIAAQQLQLAGNVQAALLAMQTADARLARSDRQQFTPLRKVLAKDIERLKATSNLDLAGLVLKLEQVLAQVDSLPLVEEARAAPAPAAAARAEQGFWSRIGTEVWDELKQLVRVQNVERPERVLLAPSQSFFLRENLKLRLLNARLALMQREQLTFRDDLNAAQSWVSRYFDLHAKPTVAVLASLKQLGASAISIEMPSIGESLSAVRNYKISREKASR